MSAIGSGSAPLESEWMVVNVVQASSRQLYYQHRRALAETRKRMLFHGSHHQLDIWHLNRAAFRCLPEWTDIATTMLAWRGRNGTACPESPLGRRAMARERDRSKVLYEYPTDNWYLLAGDPMVMELSTWLLLDNLPSYLGGLSMSSPCWLVCVLTS